MNHPMMEIINKRKNGEKCGIFSVCSANEYVIKSSMVCAGKVNSYLLIEATANQVNQFGGYTGMKPCDFASYVEDIAKGCKFPKEKLILGADHLGPLTWSNESEKSAMEKATELIRQYVQAGFTKIHVDTSMRLADDSLEKGLETGIVAKRAAHLIEEAEKVFRDYSANHPEALQPVYVVGSEVPIPGGAVEEEGLHITESQDFVNTIDTFKKVFSENMLDEVWERVIAVVVQPGVEFGDSVINSYSREKAAGLCRQLGDYPSLVFEGHSTDYQTPQSLREMVEDGIAILKVGPALTFALREGLMALNHIENELFRSQPSKLSNLMDILESKMLENPSYWNKHYHGDDEKQRIARIYSYSDRCRYYLSVPEVRDSIRKLLINLSETDIPLTLISQYMPVQYRNLRNGLINCSPEELLIDKIAGCINDYTYAITGETTKVWY